MLPSPEPEPEELVRFREAWRKELEAKRAHPGSSRDAANDPTTLTHPDSASQSSHIQRQPGPSSQTIAGVPTPSSLHSSHGTTTLARGLSSAIDIYRRAVQHEQQGQLDDALVLYRRAFRMNPNVDKAYHKVEHHLAFSDATLPRHAHKKSNSSAGAVDNPTRVDGATLTKHTGALRVVTGTLSNIIENFPQELKFQPEDERRSVPVSSLPDEILVLILRRLNPTTIERFATVNRKARVISLDSAIWRELVEMTYMVPQIPQELEVEAIADEYLSDYRRMYIEHPRLRLDGVYIAVCHYVRPGLSENAWVNISHLITYHRYLRFFPNGQVLSLLANEERDPQQIIPLLKLTLRMKGLFIGEWQLDGRTVYITNLVDASSANVALPLPANLSSSSSSTLTMPSSITNATTTSTSTSYSTRYLFQMTLTLRSRPIGRWNKLDFAGYDSVDLESGDTIPLNLKHERPFWFSKVKSYAV